MNLSVTNKLDEHVKRVVAALSVAPGDHWPGIIRRSVVIASQQATDRAIGVVQRKRDTYSGDSFFPDWLLADLVDEIHADMLTEK
jgi:hypothetical protein